MASPGCLEPSNLATVERYRALLQVSESIASHRDLPDLFRSLAALLHRLVTFDFICLTLPDLARNVVRLHVLESSLPTRIQPGLEIPMVENVRQLVWENQQPLVISHLEHDERFPIVSDMLRQDGVQSLCVLPLTTAQRRVGAMALGSVEASAYDAADLEFLRQVAAQVAVAVDNALNSQNAQIYQQELARERDRLRLLLEVNNALVSTLDLHQLLSAISACLRRVMNHDYASLALYEPAAQQLRLQALDFPQGKGLLQEEMVFPIEGTPSGEVIVTRQPLIISGANLDRYEPSVSRLFIAEGLHSGCIVPLITANRTLGTLSLSSLRAGAFTQEDVDLLMRVANQVAIAIENALAYREIAELKNKLADEKLYLEEEIRTEYTFEEIVGESPALKRVLSQVETVAPTDSSVLVLGETGTGKEVIARAIHDLSPRRERTFVKVNCAAIPTGLLESELFGHEKGAFTGAIAQKVGRFELAHRGTLFLDEVGDIPLELQPKLLRVLQEKEFERLGEHPHSARGCARRRRHQPRPYADGGGPPFPQRPLLPAERFPHRRPAVARARRGYSPAGPLLRPEARPPHGPPHRDHSRGGNGSSHALSLAGQCARTRKPDRTRRYPFARTCPARALAGGPPFRRHACRLSGDAGGRGARAHPARPARHQLGHRRPARRGGAPGHETHHPPVAHGQARHLPPLPSLR